MPMHEDIRNRSVQTDMFDVPAQNNVSDIPVHKNEEMDVEIVDIGIEGEGIGHTDGYTLFVKDAVPGDMVRVKVLKVKKNYAYARLLEILRPSKDRRVPRCSIAKQCGGCQLQHLAYDAQLKLKEHKVENCLKRIGGFYNVPIEPIMGMEMPFRYRNKAQFPVGKGNDGRPVVGFYAARTHNIMNVEDCWLQTEVNAEIMDKVRVYLEKYKVEPYDEGLHVGLMRHVLVRVGFQTGQIMVCFIVNGTSLPHQAELLDSLQSIQGMASICLNVNREKTNVILGRKTVTLWGKPYIVDAIGDTRFHISPISFYQVNPVQTAKLYEKVLQFAELVTENEIVWDLYCGIGTIALYLARKAKFVFGVEVVKQAVRDARENARLNDVANVEFLEGAAEELLPRMFQEKKEQLRADVVIVDPPRKGCDESLLKK